MMGMTIDEFNAISYFVQIAPVILVMGIAVKVLWKANLELNEKINQRDKDNLETLQEIARVLETVKDNGFTHTRQLKEHIDERINGIKDVLKQNNR